ncbi:hypothetical protein CHH57_01755 [Niallia circulans]|uniref:Uncharacterized protein n=1 Tax=Niallia circulans TaxID=1397 RepID=A0AA91TVJ4_NIACI|nr:hypothetical protein [Niallia circulans]PAD85060.1 hypothetical protein CHH57_01755 [Niallia circulans]
MNISKLQIGKEYKNYKVLCSELGEPIKSGKSKILQLEQFKNHFSYEKKGNKFVISKVFDLPAQSNAKVKGRKLDKHTDLVRSLILDELNNSDNDGHLFITANQLLKSVDMINTNYTYAKRKLLRFAKYIDMGLDEVQEFFTTSDSMLKRSIESALNSLQNESLIIWNSALTVCKADLETLTYNDLGEVQLDVTETYNEFEEVNSEAKLLNSKGKFIHRKATEEEAKLIVTERKRLLKTVYKCDNVQEVFRKNKQDEFYQELRSILMEKANIYFFYNSYEITFTEEYVNEEWNEMMEYQINRLKGNVDIREIVNDSVINKLQANSLRRHKKALITDTSKKSIAAASRINMRMKDTYAENQNRLSELLIYNKAISIFNDMEEVNVQS